MKQKTLALALMAAISFASPLAESLATGRVESWSRFDMAGMGISLVLLFWWWHQDKAERDYTSSRLMNAGVLMLAAIVLPIYFLRTRGWKRGGAAIGIGAAFLLLTFMLAEAGEWLGNWLRA